MKAILKQELNILQAQAYLELEILEEAEEIKSYLEGNKIFSDNPELDEKVGDFIKSLDLMTKDGSITKTGEEVIRTGKRYVPEAGVYTIKYSKNDSLFGNHIFSYKDYLYVSAKGKWEELEFSNSANSNLLGNDKAKLKKVKIIVNGEEQAKETYFFEKIWEFEFENSNIVNQSFKEVLQHQGRVLLEETDEYSMRRKISIEELLDQIPSDQWDKSSNRLKLSWEKISNSAIFEKILDEEFSIDFNEDHKVYLSQVPIMPASVEDALMWVEHILKEEAIKAYQTKKTYEEELNKICEDTAFATYSKALQSQLSHSEFLQKSYNQDKAKQDRVFWHLRAAYDLNPDIKINSSIQTDEEIEEAPQTVILNCAMGDKYSLQQIVDSIKDFIGIYTAPKKFIYLDPYAQQPKTQKKLLTLMQAFNVEPNQASLITLSAEAANKDRFADVLVNAGVEVLEVSKNLKENYRLPHDRYLILQYANEQAPRVFKFTNSELVRYTKEIKLGDIKAETIGTTSDLSLMESKIEIMTGALAEKINELLGV